MGISIVAGRASTTRWLVQSLPSPQHYPPAVVGKYRFPRVGRPLASMVRVLHWSRGSWHYQSVPGPSPDEARIWRSLSECGTNSRRS